MLILEIISSDSFPLFSGFGINHSRSHYSLNMVFVINLIKEIIIFVFAFHIRILKMKLVLY